MNNGFGDSETIRKAKEHKDALIENYLGGKGVLQKYMSLIPKKYHWNMYEIYTGKNSMKLAIKTKCLDCSSYQREEVKCCQVFTCPLHNFRPYK